MHTRHWGLKFHCLETRGLDLAKLPLELSVGFSWTLCVVVASCSQAEIQATTESAGDWSCGGGGRKGQACSRLYLLLGRGSFWKGSCIPWTDSSQESGGPGLIAVSGVTPATSGPPWASRPHQGTLWNFYLLRDITCRPLLATKLAGICCRPQVVIDYNWRLIMQRLSCGGQLFESNLSRNRAF